MTEEDFENSALLPEEAMPPIGKKGTHPTNPIKSNLKPSPSLVISEGNMIEIGVGGSSVVVPSKRIDKINNLVQKEINLSKAGVSRYKYMLNIAEALEALKWVDQPDEQGNIKRVQVPDVARRQWGTEMAAKLYGDMIERKEIEHDLGDKTLEKFRSLSVTDLKARAADLLLGKPVSRLPVIDITPEDKQI